MYTLRSVFLFPHLRYILICVFVVDIQLFEWNKDNVIVTGSSDGIVRVSVCLSLCQSVSLHVRVQVQFDMFY